MHVPTDPAALGPFLSELIRNGKEREFYLSPEWDRLRREVLREDRYECQLCRAQGRYHRAEIVHHINEIKHRPELALSMWEDRADGTKARNLMSVCWICHNTVCHPGRLERYKYKKRSGFDQQERWD